MNALKAALAALVIIVVLESTVIALPYLSGSRSATIGSFSQGQPQSYVFPYPIFNQPISNDTDRELQPSYNGSWLISVQSTLSPLSANRASEAQIALAPNFKTENLSIPTLIIQERADGLLRIEYYAQDWNNTFGLVLYNSTSPTWEGGQNITLRFISFGPPSLVNPQLAPRPNGNLTILIGSSTVLADYPIAWASMAHMFLYGLGGSIFTKGSLEVTFRSLEKG